MSGVNLSTGLRTLVDRLGSWGLEGDTSALMGGLRGVALVAGDFRGEVGLIASDLGRGVIGVGETSRRCCGAVGVTTGVTGNSHVSSISMSSSRSLQKRELITSSSHIGGDVSEV